MGAPPLATISESDGHASGEGAQCADFQQHERFGRRWRRQQLSDWRWSRPPRCRARIGLARHGGRRNRTSSWQSLLAVPQFNGQAHGRISNPEWSDNVEGASSESQRGAQKNVGELADPRRNMVGVKEEDEHHLVQV